MTQEQVAAMVGKSRSAIANMLRLLHFSEKVKNLLISGELTTGQARPILALESIQEQDSAAEYILKSGLNARQAEQYVKKLTEKSKQKSQSEEKEISEQIKQQEVRFVQDRLRTSLGTKVILMIITEGEK